MGGHVYDAKKNTPTLKAARWFMEIILYLAVWQLLIKLLKTIHFVSENEIEIAAIDAIRGEIYVNPTCGFSEEEWKFVLALNFYMQDLCIIKDVKAEMLIFGILHVIM